MEAMHLQFFPPTLQSVRYLENASFLDQLLGPGYSTWFLDIFLLSVARRLKKKSGTCFDVICVCVWLGARVL